MRKYSSKNVAHPTGQLTDLDSSEKENQCQEKEEKGRGSDLLKKQPNTEGMFCLVPSGVPRGREILEKTLLGQLGIFKFN